MSQGVASDLPPYSVLMGVYGGDNAQYFTQAMDSVLGQTLPCSDIVLVVDGPLHGQLEATVKQYVAQHSQIHPLWLPENVKTGRALQAALPHCRYDMVVKMDADDIALPTRVEEQLTFMAQHPGIAMVSSTIAEFQGQVDNVVSTKRVPLEDAAIRALARRWNPINQPSVVFSKQAALAVGGYQDFPRYEDYHLWVRMLAAGYKAANMEQTLVYYRLSADNLDRRRRGDARTAAIRFHLWKHRIGFAGWWDTAWMIGFMVAVSLVPGPIYRWIYRLKRR